MKRVFVMMIAAALVLSGCGGEPEPARQTIFAMNTVMDLQVWGETGEACNRQIAQLCNDLESTWSASRADSLLSRMNRGEEVELTEEQAQLLDRVKQLSERTGGAVDPTLQAVSALWDFTGETPRVPSRQEIDQALAQDRWDMGAALKGYAGQEAVAILEAGQADRAILNLGGNIQTYGEKPDGSPWVIGVQDPDGGEYVGYVQVRGTASVVTSGDYQRYFEENGTRYHHILDPKTGYPADSGLRSVTVICRDGLTADCLSTALFVMGLDAGAEFWRGSEDFEAVFVTVEGKIYVTAGVSFSGNAYEVIER